jgi:hypothetical protein
VVGVLAAIGLGAFHVVRHRPRCVITGPYAVIHVKADGSKFLTLHPEGLGLRAPLHRWDVHTGTAEFKVGEDERVRHQLVSPDGRCAALLLGDRTVRFVDLEAGEEWRIDEIENVYDFHFSSNSRWIAVLTLTGRPNYFIDIAQHKVAMRSDGLHLSLASGKPVIFGDRVLLSIGFGCELWDLNSGRRLGKLPVDSSDALASADGRFQATGRFDPRSLANFLRPVNPNKRRGIDVWELPDFRLCFRREAAPPCSCQALFSPNCQSVLLVWADRQPSVEMLDAATGRLLWSSNVKSAMKAEFSPDNALCYVTSGSQVTMLDAVTGRVLWERTGWEEMRFVAGGGSVLHRENLRWNSLIILDSRTGRTRVPEGLEGTVHALSADRQVVALWATFPRQRLPEFLETALAKIWPQRFANQARGALVIDCATGEELFRVATDERLQQRYFLSDTGHTLITSEFLEHPNQMRIRVWDVHATRAWLWSVGVTSALGLGLLGLRWVWRQRRVQRSVSKAPSGQSANVVTGSL